jgi:hypothetical protein
MVVQIGGPEPTPAMVPEIVYADVPEPTFYSIWKGPVL